MLDFPHTARELECCDFGPRVGLAYRIGDSWVVRSGYGMIFFEQSGITTPFTIPQFPFVQTVGQQSQDNMNAAFALSNGPTVQVTAPNPNSGLGARRVRRGSQQWFRLFAAVELHGAEDVSATNWNVEVAYLGSKNTRLGIPDANINQLPSQYLSLGAALLTRVPNPYFGQIPASSSLGARDHRPAAAAAALPAIHDRGAVPRQRRQLELQRCRREAGEAILARADDQRVRTRFPN